MTKFTFATLVVVLAACAPTFAQGPVKTLPVATHYAGGQEKLLADIQEKMQYPPMAKRNRIEGECIIAFTLEKDGKATNYKVIKNIGGGCGDEAMRVVQGLKFTAPGYRVDLTCPVKFALQR